MVIVFDYYSYAVQIGIWLFDQKCKSKTRNLPLDQLGSIG